jgi:hypothetical protein
MLAGIRWESLHRAGGTPDCGKRPRVCFLPLFVGSVISVLTCLIGCGDPIDLSGVGQRALADARARQSCGPSGLLSVAIPDCPLGTFCFTPACLGHDLCYAFCQTPRAECDRRFRNDMTALCFQEFTRRPHQLKQCLGFVLTYWTAVLQFGDRFYECGEPPIVDPDPDVPGACCQVDDQATCTDVANKAACASSGVFLAGLDCDEVDSVFGGCPVPANDACGERSRVCTDAAPADGTGICSGESAGPSGDRPCDTTLQDCLPGEVCLPSDRTAYRCSIVSDNRLAQTDGPEVGVDCAGPGVDRFQADIWFEYVAPCSGTLTVGMCGGLSYDAMLAVYGSNVPDGTCTCPEDDATQLTCDDDSCGGFGTTAIGTVEQAVEGACYLIRVGGWSIDQTPAGADRGIAQIDIGMVCNE